MPANRLSPTGPGFTVRIPRDLVEEVRRIAISHDRSLSAELRIAMRAYIEQHANGVGA